MCSASAIIIFTALLSQCLASDPGLLIRVNSDGADTAECVLGEKPCLTLNYALTKLQDRKSDQPGVEIMVSSPQQKFPCQGVYDFNFTSLTITGIGDVTFSGLFGMTFEPDLKNVFVQVKGIRFENCGPTKLDSDPFNPGVVFAFIDTLIFEDCKVHYGSSLFVRVQNLTVDSCLFSDFSSSALPVLTSWVSFPGSKLGTRNLRPQPRQTVEKPKIGTIVVRNSLITNNSGRYTGPSDDYPGPGYMLVDVSGLPIDQYFEIVHYDILVENCNFTNNDVMGRTTPFLYSNYGENFSANFTLLNNNFVNNTITPNKQDYGFDSFPLLSLSMNTNTSYTFTVLACSFINYSYPPTALLGSYNTVQVRLNVLDSTFQSSDVPKGLQVIQKFSGSSSNNITTNFKGNKHV